MKLIHVISRATSVEIEGETQIDVFRELAAATEVFGISACGACKSDGVYPRVRTVDGNAFPEWVCSKCRSVLALGQSRKNGGLYPRRKTKDGKFLANGGWAIFKSVEAD